MLAVLAIAAVGLGVDDRLVTGVPAWLKPAKFAVSVVIYTLTLAAVFTLLPTWRRLRRIVGWGTGIALALEMVIIVGQAVRGVPSHFNTATPLDAALFSVMGAVIFTQTFATVAVAVALWRTRFPDAALGWALRWGMTLTIVGALSGSLMTRPTPAQLEVMQRGGVPAAVGAHTVGAPDGGPGLPGTGWSTRAGDLRVPHFVGLHALQVLPLVAMALAVGGVAARQRLRATAVACASYTGLFLLLLAQALSGRPVTWVSDGWGAALLAWAAASGVALILSVSTGRRSQPGTHATPPSTALTAS